MEIDESRVKLMCILTTDAKRGSNDDKIKPFTEETWIKVQTAARTILSLIKSSKYDVICRSLPSSFQSIDGYHYSCYKPFTAVRKPQQFQNIRPRRESGEKLLRSDTGIPHCRIIWYIQTRMHVLSTENYVKRHYWCRKIRQL